MKGRGEALGNGVLIGLGIGGSIIAWGAHLLKDTLMKKISEAGLEAENISLMLQLEELFFALVILSIIAIAIGVGLELYGRAKQSGKKEETD